jgi:heterodisulfide reductase subunit A-like polyferredoxin/coenzyme F420-reducing hydrogenase delta subunit
MTRIGVFFCGCNGEIGSTLDGEALARGARELPNVAVVRRLPFACSPDGLAAIRRTVTDEGLDRVVVGGCTWRTMKPRFQEFFDRGMVWEMVGLREGCARVHRDDPAAATVKALDMTRMGVAKVALMETYGPITATVTPTALVIGGGLAGMTAAKTLADNGVPVTLVERAPALGGMLRRTHTPYPDGRPAANDLGERIQAVTQHPQINVLLASEVAGVSGTAGHYTVTVRKTTERPSDSLALDVGAVIVATGAQHEGLGPQDGAPRIARLFGLTRDALGFFADSRYRLRPEETVERGIYVAGAAHHPTSQDETEFQAYSVALRALGYLQRGTLVSRAPVARVDERLCTGCGTCVEVCAFGAITMQPRTALLDVSHVDPLLCKGCGNCVVACPSKAITTPLDSDEQMLAQISAALATGNEERRPRVLVFGCQWSGHAAAELAGARGLRYPAAVRLIPVRCSARFDPLHILWAFLNGAAGVFLGACPPGECHYLDGNRYAEERITTLQEMLAQHGFDVRRLQLKWIKPDDPGAFVELISDFAAFIAALEGVSHTCYLIPVT